MQIEYQEKNNRRYMILTTEGLQVDDYQIHMMQENQIRGLLECRLKKIDDRKCYVYEVTGMHSLEENFQYRKITAEDLKNLLSDLSELLVEISAYLLKESSILLGAEYIYTDMEEKRYYFCCCPENENNLSDGLKGLGEYILPRLDHGDRQAVALGYDFYQKAMDGRAPEDLFTNLLQADVTEEESIFEEDQERKELLDHFFTDDEEEDDEDDREFTRGMKILWILVTSFLAVVATVAGWLFDFLQAGLAAGVIIIALSVWIYMKKKEQLRKEENMDDNLSSYETGFMNFEEEEDEQEPEDKRRKRKEGRKGKGKIEKRLIRNEESWAESREVPIENRDRLTGVNTEQPEIRKRQTEMKTGQSGKWKKLIENGYGQAENRDEEVGNSGNGKILKYEKEDLWNGPEIQNARSHTQDLPVRKVKKKEIQSRVGRPGGEWTSSEWDKETVLLARTPEESNPKKFIAKLLFENINKEEVKLDQQVYFIGKSRTAADIVLPSQSVSRIHARLDRTDQGYQIFDLSSRNGTYVNGKKLEVGQSLTIADGDHIRIGDVEMRSSLQ